MTDWIETQTAKQMQLALMDKENGYKMAAANLGAEMSVRFELNPSNKSEARVILTLRHASSGNTVTVTTSEATTPKKMMQVAKKKLKERKNGAKKDAATWARINAS